ncbi:MAG: threonylcarbamoyl-AMP synthase [Rhodanobacteraceae bacterium]|nr:threonylcarbamoyl-AMP synthase [Rhodanobacteraceae bacterium]
MPTPTKKQIHAAAEALQRGELVAIPTETVYGLAADATNDAAVKRVFAAKGRPANHPLIVHVAKGDDLKRWAKRMPAHATALTEAFWPGPLTLILEKTDEIPDTVTGGQNTVGLRCPAHPVAQALLVAFAEIGSGIVAAPSANRFGHVSPTSAAHVMAEFGELVVEPGDASSREHITLLDGGNCDVGIESTILDLTSPTPRLLRPGAIGIDDIQRVIGIRPRLRDELQAGADVPRVSGALAAHYAPRTPMYLVSRETLAAEVDRLVSDGKRVAALSFTAEPKVRPSPAHTLVWIQAPLKAGDYARDLYANLRALDAAVAAMILVEAPPRNMEWDAVNDRLSRAQTGAGKHA